MTDPFQMVDEEMEALTLFFHQVECAGIKLPPKIDALWRRITEHSIEHSDFGNSD